MGCLPEVLGSRVPSQTFLLVLVVLKVSGDLASAYVFSIVHFYFLSIDFEGRVGGVIK